MEIKERNSNFELMRIISMLFIILYHIIIHGQVVELCTNDFLRTLFKIIEIATLVHVNSFILLTGYFQSTCRFKQSKVWKIINASLFYRIIIVIVLTTMGIITLDKLSIFKNFFPLEIYHNWFIKYYIILYCMSPLLNASINHMNRKTFKRTIIVLFFLFCLFPTLTGCQTFENNGYTLYHFIYLYLIGAYLRKFSVFKSSVLKDKSVCRQRFILTIIIALCIGINFIIYKFALNYVGNNNFIRELCSSISLFHLYYNNPLVLLQSVCYFLLFSTFNIKSKLINIISSLTIGIYLIHDNTYIRTNIYTWLGINTTPVTSIVFLVRYLLITFIIFISCAIIEYIRQKLFSFIYNLKFSKVIRNRYYYLLEKMGI